MEDDYTAALRLLMRLRDAFEQLYGTPANPRSKEALEIAETLREWEATYGLEQLAEAERAHREGLEG